MITVLAIGIIICFGYILLLGYRQQKLSLKIEVLESDKKSKNPEKGDIVLKKLKDMPDITAVDPDHQLLKDVIETAKTEGWKADIEDGWFTAQRSWTFIITNPTQTVSIMSILRLYDNEPKLGYFNITSGSNGVGYVTLSKEDKISRYLIIEYLWGLIVEKNDNDYTEQTKSYLKSKEIIEKELKSLKRDRQLKKLFEDEKI